ncbi:histidyl-tRNA synthetase [Desulfitobacterium dichloroeliminans LMG P-21439]|uniref:Histidine--tRNA ligase n=1 Tax=Desulfitobacterium dichloroeliminans (strain LMG P-21439 / DCA1) TaxID=871963 RepID=L0F9N7_DESDL|nr:histidine--tRNA ligase [Desulfitobacterium dichloroeliminans]AGA69922.1 histidyl-tRNA synthetase [Desulfitobacterium dichloroeliminans LMG P-21439]
MAIQRPKGTQDLLPGVVEQWQGLEEQIRKICKEYGYQEIRTPMFEATELFQRGVGETTDIVNKEMYTFLDKGDRSITLRPEGTASVCRAYVENKLYGGPQPVKLYYIGPMFRYERPQSGRFRQFHQFGVEVLGADKPMVDAEVITLVWDLYSRLGLKGLEVHVNSVGCPTCRPEHKQKLQEFLEPHKEQLCKDCQSRFEKNPLRILDCKNSSCQEITQGAPTTLDVLCEDCAGHFAELKRLLTAAEVVYKVNPRLVRGLDYYRKTAFEVLVEDIGAQSAICGGGRYDGLVQEVGGPQTPGIGFAMGMERVLAALKLSQEHQDEDKKEFLMLVALGEKAQSEGFAIISRLRKKGLPVSIDLLGRSLKAQLKAADRVQAKYAGILGEEELSKGIIILRNLRLGEQEELTLKEFEEQVLKQYKEDGNQ